MSGNKISLVIPAHNEKSTLISLVEDLKTLKGIDEILIIDDGSTDDTQKALVAAQVRVIRHPNRRGNGAAVKTGLQNAKGDWVLILDADGQHQLEDIRRLIEAPDEYDLVVGARSFRWMRFRDFGNLVLSKVANFLLHASVPDLTSGLRRINRKAALQFWHLYPEGYSFPTTSTLLFVSSGYTVNFMPIPNRPRPANASPSKLRPLREGMRFLTIIYRMILLTYPLRFFAPVGLFVILAGTGWTLRTLRLSAQVSAAGTLMLLSGLTLLLFGTVADQLSQIRKSIAAKDRDVA